MLYFKIALWFLSFEHKTLYFVMKFRDKRSYPIWLTYKLNRIR